MLLPTNEKQFGFWKMRRSGSSNITIANLLGISRQAVSKALLVMDEKIESILRDMANANQIAIEKINAERGSYSGTRFLFIPLQSFSFLTSTGCRSGTSMTATAGRVRGIPNVSSCYGIMQPSLESGSKKPLTRQKWQMNCLRK